MTHSTHTPVAALTWDLWNESENEYFIHTQIIHTVTVHQLFSTIILSTYTSRPRPIEVITELQMLMDHLS